MQDFNVVVYTHDSAVFSTLLGLVGIEGNVVLAEDDILSTGHLVCIDYSYPHRSLVLDALSDFPDVEVVAVISANPFAISQLEGYAVDAFLSKPLNSEAVQALLVGTKARLAQKGLYG